MFNRAPALSDRYQRCKDEAARKKSRKSKQYRPLTYKQQKKINQLRERVAEQNRHRLPVSIPDGVEIRN